MSITRTSTVVCELPPEDKPRDAHGVALCTGWTGETVYGAREARRIAREHGWVRIDGKDLCPKCADAVYSARRAGPSHLWDLR